MKITRTTPWPTVTFTKCPLCGSKRVQHLVSDYLLPTSSKPILVSSLERHECPRCDEIFFDMNAMQRIEQARKSKRRKYA